MNEEKENCAKISIGRRSSNTGKDVIALEIHDSLSGNMIVAIEMSLENYAKASTGLSYVKGEYKFCPTPESAKNYQKERIIKNVFCKKSNSYTREDQKQIVLKDFMDIWFSYDKEETWELQDDGCYRQQPGELHEYTIKKYISPKTNNE